MKMPLKKKPKVLIAMSGGVDSSVAAALLCKDKKYEVAGACMRQWSDTQDASGVCSWKKDRRDALRVAAKLGIPLITLNFEKEYKEWVMEYMFREYEAGRTPNPDVLCNKYVKFGFWLDKALEIGFDYLATGHYARIAIISHDQISPLRKGFAGRAISNIGQIQDPRSQIQLLQAKDKNKDQTYFLHQLNQKQLAHSLFPIGDYHKSEVRTMARRFGLPTAEREESMGICFIGERPMTEFLKQKIKPKPGNIVTTSGKILGGHEGLAFYTIGQRHLGIESGIVNNESGNSRPVYVIGKRCKTNELVVGYENDPARYTTEVNVVDAHWIAGLEPRFPLDCKVRLRHRQELQKCRIMNQESGIMIEFNEPQKAATPGQFAVFYKGQVCLGGGIIAL